MRNQKLNFYGLILTATYHLKGKLNISFEKPTKELKKYAIRESIPQKLLRLVLNALVLSHLQYSAVVF